MNPKRKRAILQRQNQWFGGIRNRLLREADIANRRRVLDLGSGTGEVTKDLRKRVGGLVVGIDKDLAALHLDDDAAVAAHAESLPFPDETFDLVFTQMFFLWATPLEGVLNDIHRVLAPGGYLIATAEPDYGGVIQHPNPVAEDDALTRFIRSLEDEGANTRVGRRLGSAITRAGFQTLKCSIHPPNPLKTCAKDRHWENPTLFHLPTTVDFLFVPYFYFLAIKCLK